jgi:hypothetical protein
VTPGVLMQDHHGARGSGAVAYRAVGAGLAAGRDMLARRRALVLGVGSYEATGQAAVITTLLTSANSSAGSRCRESSSFLGVGLFLPAWSGRL